MCRMVRPDPSVWTYRRVLGPVEETGFVFGTVAFFIVRVQASARFRLDVN